MLSAMEFDVGRPKITLVIDALAPTAFPIAEFAKAAVAAATSSDLLEMGLWAQ